MTTGEIEMYIAVARSITVVSLGFEDDASPLYAVVFGAVLTKLLNNG